MHCLVVTIYYCVDNHFTSFAAALLLAMLYNEFCSIICAIHRKNSLVMNIGHRKTEKFDISTLLVLSHQDKIRHYLVYFLYLLGANQAHSL